MSACAVGLLRESILIRRRRNSFALLMVVKDGEYAHVRVGDLVDENVGISSEDEFPHARLRTLKAQ